MTIMVWGGAGFVGGHLVSHLLALGHHVVLAQRQPRPPDDHRVDMATADITEPESVRRAIAQHRPDCVVNLTTSRGPDLPAMRDVNERAVEGLARVCAEHGVTRLVHVTSATEYGSAAAPLSEDGPREPTTDYGRTKLAGSRAVLKVAADADLDGVVLVLFLPYGVGAPRRQFIPTVLRLVRDGAPVPLTPLGCTRDYVAVTDAAVAVAAATTTPGLGVATINICSGTATDNHQVVDIVERMLGRTACRQIGDVTPRPWDRADWRGDPTRAENLLGWRATTDLERGIALLARAEP